MAHGELPTYVSNGDDRQGNTNAGDGDDDDYNFGGTSVKLDSTSSRSVSLERGLFKASCGDDSTSSGTSVGHSGTETQLEELGQWEGRKQLGVVEFQSELFGRLGGFLG